MYKFSEIRVREIASDETISSFEESCRKSIDWKLIDHMMVRDWTHLDLDKAKDAREAALFYYLTKDPTKQSRGQNKQRKALKAAFFDIEQLNAGTVTILNGKKLLSSEVVGGIQDDIDFISESEKILLSAKDVDGDGGEQNDQFDEMVRLIERAGEANDVNSWVLGIYLNGSLWDKLHKGYRNFHTKYGFPTSLRQLLVQMAKGKKVVIFSDANLPSKKTCFRKHFGV